MFDKVLPIAKPDLVSFDEVVPDLKEIFSSGMITNYKFVRQFESELAEFLDVKFVVCVANGTLGLMIAAKALGLEGEVIIPSFTFSATPHSYFLSFLAPRITILCQPLFQALLRNAFHYGTYFSLLTWCPGKDLNLHAKNIGTGPSSLRVYQIPPPGQSLVIYNFL